MPSVSDGLTQDDSVILDNGVLRAVISPSRGGSVLSLDASGDGGRPVLRPWRGTPAPADRAMLVMLPWCNRISGGGFSHDGHFHALSPNLADQDMPIHGSGFGAAWTIAARTENSVSLVLSDRSVPPFAFSAQLDYRLEAAGFTAALGIRHEGDGCLPYGLGFHPWFAWSRGDCLSFRARAYARENDRRLPVAIVPLTEAPDQGFEMPHALPEDLINQTYLDWDGRAAIARPDGSSVQLTATGATRHLHVFARGNDGGFVCLEPVSHTTDAVNRPLHASALPVPLAKNQTLSASLAITLRADTVQPTHS